MSVDSDPFWYAGRQSLAALDPHSLRVAVWNICKGAGGHLFHHDFRKLCYTSDLVLLQEALLSQRSLRAFVEPGFRMLHAASYMRQDRVRDGVLSAARSDVTSPPQRIVCKYPEPIFRTPKVALVTQYPLQGQAKPLLVINIHATLVRSARRAVEELHHVIAALPAHDGPAILAGDFNTFTPAYLQFVTQVLSSYGFEMAEISQDPRAWYNNLDQVFVRGIKVNECRVLTDIQSSDHFPIYFTGSVLTE
jgi:endonuclease/exonuclease/phosphatase (EEP) superfamily protein YafD